MRRSGGPWTPISQRAHSPASGSARLCRRAPEQRRKGQQNIGLMENVPIAQFHDAYGVGRPPVIGDDALTDPEVAVPQDSAHRKVPIGRVASTLFLDGIPPAEPFPGLRIV